MKKVFFASLFVVLVSSGCSEYNKVLKSSDIQYKYDKGVEYFDDDKFFNALPIFEELIGLTRGTQMAEKVYYYHAQTNYFVRDYYLANYYLTNFTKTFSYSPLAEDCQFLAAMCSYKLSPVYSLDQTDTKVAINEMQLFLDTYPSTSLRDSCNKMVMELNAKLERKSYEVAQLYEKTAYYKSAVIALEDAIVDYPTSPYREDMFFLMVRASFKYAEKSIDEVKVERYNECMEHYYKFVASYPKSDFLKSAETYFEASREEIERLNEKL
ncbi:MAG: outer membrane protein assembly factor BamD [Flavobacteriales bacterium]|jgi:outer membrane protein assembly factor BamD